MPRPSRRVPGNTILHVFNRRVIRLPLFETRDDYAAFEELVAETLGMYTLRLCSYCFMPNHWHFVAWTREEGDLTRFMHRLTSTHARRWQHQHGCSGTGHLYQGRFKSFTIEDEAHFLRVVRYVERNALRANLVERAEDWRWSSLWSFARGLPSPIPLESPLPRPANWIDLVNEPLTEAELERIRKAVHGKRS